MSDDMALAASGTGLSSSTAPEVAALRASIPSAWQNRAWLGGLTKDIGLLRGGGGEIALLSLAARGPSADCPDGNVVVTIEARGCEATGEAIHLQDALYIAACVIDRAVKAKEAAKAKAASGIEARSGETQSGSTEGESPAAESRDAQTEQSA